MLQDTRDIITGLCRVTLQSLDIPKKQRNKINQVNDKENTIKFILAKALIPVEYTWTRAINRGYFNTWPGLTAKDINKIPKDEATIKGHIVQFRNHAHSTKTNKTMGDKHTNIDPIKEKHNRKTELVMATVEKTHRTYTDYTGKSSMTSSKGNKYLLIMYVYNYNKISS